MLCSLLSQNCICIELILVAHFSDSLDCRKLNHPNIVRFFGMTEIDNMTYIVTEFLSLGNALNYVHQNKKGLSMLDLVDM